MTNLYQTYNCSLPSMKIVKEDGGIITFSNNLYYTAEEEEISFLDQYIELGGSFVTKGQKMTAEELNPEAIAKKKMKEELRQEVMKEVEAEKASDLLSKIKQSK